MSAYARQFLGQMDKPDVDSIEGLSPAISIDQKTTSRNPRSTVGTVTEIYDYLRLLWSRVGKPHCPICGRPIVGQSAEQIIDQAMELADGTRFMVLAPVVRGRKGEYGKLLEELRNDGFARVKIDDRVRMLEESIVLDKRYKHDISVVVDRLAMRHDVRKRLADSIETAVGLADGLVEIEIVGRPPKRPRTSPRRPRAQRAPRGRARRQRRSSRARRRSRARSSPSQSASPAPSTARRWSSSSRASSPSTRRTARATAAPAWARRWRSTRSWSSPTRRCRSAKARSRRGPTARSNYYEQVTEAIAERYGVDLEAPWEELPQEQRELFLEGTNGEPIHVSYRNRYGRRRSYATRFEGIVKNLQRRYRETDSEWTREKIEEFMSLRACPVCGGARLRAESRAVLVGGTRIEDFCALSARRALEWLEEVELSETDRHVARLILREISERLQFLENVGIGYLSMDRAAATLSGGEAQRIRLATQIGSSLVGVLYILDEPSIGLHQRDNSKLIATLERLRDLGNTVIVVEHDEQTMRSADHLVDLGPGAGEHGGRIVAQGTRSAGAARQGLADRPVPRRHAHDRAAGRSGARRAATWRSSAPQNTTCATSTCTSRSAC